MNSISINNYISFAKLGCLYVIVKRPARRGKYRTYKGVTQPQMLRVKKAGSIKITTTRKLLTVLYLCGRKMGA